MPFQNFLPNNSRASFIRCQICAHSPNIARDAQLIPYEQLQLHIAEHINYRPTIYGPNARMEMICKKEYEDCLCLNFAEQLSQFNGGDTHRRRQHCLLTVAPRLSAPNASSSLVLPSPLPSSLTSSSFLNVLPSLPSATSSCNSLCFADTEEPAAEDQSIRQVKSSKIELSSNCSSDVKETNTNNNEAESVQFYNNLQRMQIEETENVPDHRQPTQTERAEERGGTKGGKKRHSTTEKGPTVAKKTRNNSKGGQAEKRRINKELAWLMERLPTVDTLLDRSCKKSVGFSTVTRRQSTSAGGTVQQKGQQKTGNKGRQNDDRSKKPLTTKGNTPRDNRNSINNSCICGNPVNNSKKKFIVGCSKCKAWFHGKCVQISAADSKRIPFWLCAKCQKQQQVETAAEEEDDDIQPMYCVCRMPNNEEEYVGCDGCCEWFHPKCIGATQKTIDAPYFLCPTCKKRPPKWFKDKLAHATKREPEN